MIYLNLSDSKDTDINGGKTQCEQVICTTRELEIYHCGM